MNSELEYMDLRSKIISVVEQQKTKDSLILRKAYALSAFFLMKEVDISEKDILAGRIQSVNTINMVPVELEEEIRSVREQKDRWIDLEKIEMAEQIGIFCRNAGNHVVPAYDMLIREGIQSRIDKITKYLQKKNETSKKDFYRAELMLMYSFQRLILRYGKKAGDLYLEGKRKENLLKIEQVCQRIAYNPPGNFLEAVQLVLLAHECVVSEAGSGSISFGRLDQYLYPYYKNDIEKGLTDKEEIYEIIVAFWQKIAELEKSWQHITLGGSDKDGNDESNDLTLLCMDATLDVRSDQPQLSLRIHKNMPDVVWDKAFEVIKSGMGFPALFHDKISVEAKKNAGVSEEDAWNYSVIGCVELTIGGKEYSHTEGARINWVKVLELILNKGKCTITGGAYKLTECHSLDEFETFDAFYRWYKNELVNVTEEICRFIDVANGQYTKKWPVPFVSSIMQGCLEKGKDVTDCGTIYNNLSINCVGFASTVDSLEAIDELVFKQKLISLKEYALALQKNFCGYGWLQEKAKICSKYGNDIEVVDKKAKELSELFINTLRNYKVKYRNGVIQAGFYTSYFHSDFGKMTGATPDGRSAGLPLSNSLSAMSGMDRKGPTALINSANKICMNRYSNGMALDLKFLRTFFDRKEHQKALRILVEEYFEEGGMEVQFNVASKKILVEAQKKPIKYANLIVRVSGFSAYFRTLDKELQDEIINRTEYEGC